MGEYGSVPTSIQEDDSTIIEKARRRVLLCTSVSFALAITLFFLGSLESKLHSRTELSNHGKKQTPAKKTQDPEHVTLHQSSRYGGELLEAYIVPGLSKSSHKSSKGKKDGKTQILVDTSAVQHEIMGFGAAFTDSAAINFFGLSEDARNEVMDAYFGTDGIGYTIIRIPMGSCDFSVEQYNFDDVEGDYELEHFDTGLAEEQKQRIPMLRDALERVPDLKVFVSPWSPPAWMKNPVEGEDGVVRQAMIRSSWPLGLLDDPEIRDAWALYFSKFISSYEAQGIPIWGLTVQNEPENPGPWEACVWNATTEAGFLRDHLGPVMRRDHPDVQLMAYDHNRDHLLAWTEVLLSDPVTASYVDGVAFHWYFGGEDRGMDGSYGWSNLRRAAREILPAGKFLLSSESCHCPGVDRTPDGGWARAEKMSHDIIADLAAGAAGWVDWNIMLSAIGGPNHAGNLCDAPVTADTEGTDAEMGPMFYHMGHISKFMVPGSHVVDTSIKGEAYSSKHLGGRASGALRMFEATVWPCSGGIRQRWSYSSSTGHIMLSDQMTEYFEYWKPVCLGSTADVWTGAVTLVACDEATAGIWRVSHGGALQLDSSAVKSVIAQAADVIAKAAEKAAETITDIIGSPVDESTESPIDITDAPIESTESPVDVTESPTDVTSETDVVVDDAGDGVRRRIDEAMCLEVLADGGLDNSDDGAVMTLAPCHGKGGKQSVVLSSKAKGKEGGEIIVEKDKCLTAGWPFLSTVAAVRPDGKTVVVVLNEANEDVLFDIVFTAEGESLEAAIPARSIQTYVV